MTGITVRIAGLREITVPSLSVDITEATPYLSCNEQLATEYWCEDRLAEHFRYSRTVRLDIGEGRVLAQVAHMVLESTGYVLVCRPRICSHS